MHINRYIFQTGNILDLEHMNINIKIPGINLFGNNNELKSTNERLERQEKRDNQIAFFEQQKENLKYMKAESLDEISRKLNMLHGYDNEIMAAKTEYNNSQMLHVMDEAMERGEKIAEEVEKYAPKTPEECREEIIEEATGIEKNEGILSDIMDELTELEEEMLETDLENNGEQMEELSSVEDREQIINTETCDFLYQSGDDQIPLKYKRIDYRV